MINQRLYPDIILGNGSSSQTIAKYGCYLCSLNQGLNDRGYNFNPITLNQLFIDKGVFEQGSNLLSSTKIRSQVPDIFLEGRNEAWNDANFIKYLNDKSYVVLGEVSGKGIGGSGQHFVYVQKADIVDGKISMTYIGDPWDGLDNQKITNRYNQYGNILSLRVFRVKIGGSMPDDEQVNKELEKCNADLSKSRSETTDARNDRGRMYVSLGLTKNITDDYDNKRAVNMIDSLITTSENYKTEKEKFEKFKEEASQSLIWIESLKEAYRKVNEIPEDREINIYDVIDYLDTTRPIANLPDKIIFTEAISRIKKYFGG